MQFKVAGVSQGPPQTIRPSFSFLRDLNESLVHHVIPRIFSINSFFHLRFIWIRLSSFQPVQVPWPVDSTPSKAFLQDMTRWVDMRGNCSKPWCGNLIFRCFGASMELYLPVSWIDDWDFESDFLWFGDAPGISCTVMAAPLTQGGQWGSQPSCLSDKQVRRG